MRLKLDNFCKRREVSVGAGGPIYSSNLYFFIQTALPLHYIKSVACKWWETVKNAEISLDLASHQTRQDVVKVGTLIQRCCRINKM